MTYFKQLDAFRFFAAFSVLTAHWLHFNPIVSGLKLGFIGVDFFFVVSGFLISFQLYELRDLIISKKIKFPRAIFNFTMRRGLRIFPLYYLVLILATLFNKGEIRDAFIYNVSYTSNFYFIHVQEWNSIFSHFWSLSVEEHFYIFWPFLVLILRPFIIPYTAFLIIVFSIVFRYVSFTHTHDYFTVYIHTFACLDSFMFGAILAYFFKNYKNQFLHLFSLKSIRYAIVFTLLISYIGVINSQDSLIFTWVFFRSIFGILSAGLIGLLVVGFKGKAGAIFEHKLLIMGGKLSYAIYLLHNFVPGILLEVKKFNLPTFMEFTIYFTTTIILSVLLHKLIEIPFRKIGNRFKIKNGLI